MRSLPTPAARALCLLLAGMMVLPGCTRMFWRSQADFDTYNLLMQKTQDPRWDLPRVTVDADVRSRFYEPFDPDRPPLPPDDPSAQQYMRVVDGMPGYKSWHKLGESLTVENPQWMNNFLHKAEVAQAGWEESTKPSAAAIEAGTAVPSRFVPTVESLTLEQAIELAHIHNRDLQTQIENVYLSALLLTFDQFQFQVRYLGLGNREPTSSLNYINVPSTSDNLAFNNRFGVSQLLPSGGQWVLELANNTLWLFSGQNQTSSASVLTYSLTQPLLLGAGRKVVLENLTQSEREVLYDVRTLARFRKIFFSNVVVNGQGGGQTGYLALLRAQQQVLNQRDNIRQLMVQVERRRGQDDLWPTVRGIPMLPPGVMIPEAFAGKLEFRAVERRLRWKSQDPISPDDRDQLLALSNDPLWQRSISDLYSQSQSGVVTLELAQLLTRLSSQIISLRQLERQYLDSVDAYKLVLGLPTDFQTTIDMQLLKPFELIDPRINAVEQDLLDFKNFLSSIDEDEPDLAVLRDALARLEQLRLRVQQDGLDVVAEDFRRVDANLPERLAKLELSSDRDVVLQDLERSRRIFSSVVVEDGFQLTTKEMQELGTVLSAPEVPLELRQRAAIAIDDQREQLIQTTQNLKSVEASLRSELIKLQPFDMTQEQVVALAVENRLDLMNTRAQVVDARRQMEVAANRLEAVLNVVARGDIGTSGGNKPFDFRGDRSTFQVGVQFTAPLDQVLERNAYRTAQVNYERARRAYMELEDSIKLQVRTEWRQLQVLKLNFETTRQNLRIAALQLDNAIETFNAPPAPGSTGRATTGGQNQGLNLINALQSVLQAQNDLIGIWIQYEQNRINIHRDMDIMQVDERGLWLDPVYQTLGASHDSSPTLSEPADDRLQPPAPLPVPDDRAADGGTPDEAFEMATLGDRRGPARGELRSRPRFESAGAVARPGRSQLRLVDSGAESGRATLRSLDAGNGP